MCRCTQLLYVAKYCGKYCELEDSYALPEPSSIVMKVEAIYIYKL